MKTCSKCKESKDLKEFRGPYCIPCTRAYQKDRYYNKHQNELDRKKKERQKSAKRNYEIIMEAAKDGCVLCDENDFRCLEFDHIDRSTKSFAISEACGQVISVKRLKDELAKCRVLCSNCHRKHTAEQLGFYKNYI